MSPRAKKDIPGQTYLPGVSREDVETVKEKPAVSIKIQRMAKSLAKMTQPEKYETMRLVAEQSREAASGVLKAIRDALT